MLGHALTKFVNVASLSHANDLVAPGDQLLSMGPFFGTPAATPLAAPHSSARKPHICRMPRLAFGAKLGAPNRPGDTGQGRVT